LGYAEKERQHANQRIADRKAKTGFIPSILIIHFNVGVAHFYYDEIVEEGGYWIALSSYFLINENNRSLIFNELVKSLLGKAREQAKRPNVKKWVSCDNGN
jgi:hypothetical protein